MQQNTTNPEFQLSDPGIVHSDADADLMAYLQSYGLPYPPVVRYGNILFNSRQEKHRVLLFGQAWLPPHPRGTIFLVHGFGEHSGNYSALIHDLVAADYAVAALDLRGHGLSEGPRGHTDTAEAYVEDFEQFAGIVFPRLSASAPLYLWGHSMGGQICLQAIQRGKLPKAPAAFAMTSPFLGFRRFTDYRAFLMKLVPIISRIFPALPLSSGFGQEDRSANRDYAAKRAEDPLVHDTVTPLWTKCALASMEKLREEAPSFRESTPTLMLLAGDERVTDILAARAFAFAAYQTLRHKVIEFPGMRHELEKEAVRERVVSETIAWFETHQ